ncbi:tetratricopeptide repeat protein [Rhizobium ruizarguesonis]|uniref:adenylate/guanylate cyclase domain-containing protein n=1 Tax=Rhizobium ruizarguesonis TaxID=2081791 RepID=UPI00102F4446|nr:adenylate/guanylate cyclase domain-containing protein [Rhizobium ruizarguesonis]TAZ95034.1 tetratricopeptide repeat protein [Rhizobium ruizarguesonis]TBA37916.1 tetratricopeptide repeat protein [Rhizobium ruizarguesonis]TBC63272.1 tetratricopeptide repeat protein [Rhizobium ruizarguesonis]
MQRKLAAILAGDIVGYSRLMAENEATTYAELRSVFDDVIDPAVQHHGGRTFKNSGDGFLATFPSVNEALNAAVEIQNGFDTRPFEFRIGINLGDVIEDNGDMYGDGVNVASRLEAMADPGSIFVSGAVVLSADRGRGDEFFRIGRRYAKNLPEPLDVYAVTRAGRRRSKWSRYAALVPHVSARLGYCLGAASLVLIGIAIQPLPLAAMIGRIPAELSVLAGGERADPRSSVAVMPFDNMSGEATQAYFADGLTEDITTELARNSELQVIARNSTYAMRNQEADIRKVGEKLGVAYVVEGSARRVGDKLRVAAQLIDVYSGAHLWSRSYDRHIDDIFTVESELTSEIVAHLVSFVRKSEAAEAMKRPTKDLQAYDLVLQARARFTHDSKDAEGLLSARGLFQRALELDPAYAVARANLGMTYIFDVTQNVSGHATDRDLEIGLSEARQSIRLDPNLAMGYQVLSYGLAASGDYAGALQAGHRSVELNPNDPDSMMALAKAQVRFGDYDGALRNAERARRLHPIAPEYYAYVHGQALYAAGRSDEAASVIQECLIRAPQDSNCLLIQTALQAGRSELDKAKATMANLVKAKPDFSLETERNYRRFGDSPLMEQFLADLARAEAPKTVSLQRPVLRS